MVYKRIQEDTGRETSGKECLQLSFFATSCTVDPEGLCQELLVFGAVPRPARRSSARS